MKARKENLSEARDVMNHMRELYNDNRKFLGHCNRWIAVFRDDPEMKLSWQEMRKDALRRINIYRHALKNAIQQVEILLKEPSVT